MQPFSKHAGFFASLKQVEDRLASEQQQKQRKPPPPQPPPQQRESSPFSDTLTASSPIFLNATTSSTVDRGGAESSGPALDFLTLSKDEEHIQEHQEYANVNDDSVDDIGRLMALLGLSPPPGGGGGDGGGCNDCGGCDCSGGDEFMAKVVGVIGPKCEKEKRRVDGWIEYYCRGGGCMEPARLSHLLLAKASWSWDEGAGGRTAIAFPATVKEFLEHDTPPRWPEEEEGREAQ